MTQFEKQVRRTMGDYLWYIMVGFVSILALLFLPFLGTTAEMGWNWPTTAAGWLVFCVTKLFVVALNFIIFHSFIQQARLNIRDNQSYKEAVKILRRIDPRTKKPLSLQQFNKKEYGQKGVITCLTTLLSAFSLGQAILTFDWVSFLSYLFTIAIGVIFGILEMKKYQDFYCTDYWQYAKWYEQQLKQTEQIEETNEENDLSALEQEDSVDDSTVTC